MILHGDIFSHSAIFMVSESLLPIEFDMKCTVQRKRGPRLMVATHCNTHTLRKTLALPVLHADNWVYLYLSIYLPNMYIQTDIHTCMQSRLAGTQFTGTLWYSVYCLLVLSGTQFTCFTGTKLQIKTQKALLGIAWNRFAQFSLLSFLPIMTTPALTNTGRFSYDVLYILT